MIKTIALSSLLLDGATAPYWIAEQVADKRGRGEGDVVVFRMRDRVLLLAWFATTPSAAWADNVPGLQNALVPAVGLAIPLNAIFDTAADSPLHHASQLQYPATLDDYPIGPVGNLGWVMGGKWTKSASTRRR